jgi:cyclic-di-GMP-binding protein
MLAKQKAEMKSPAIPASRHGICIACAKKIANDTPVMPSFDIVSQVNSMEIENAVNQAKKELANRFDFKGSNAEIILEKNEIKLSATDAFKVQALNEMVIGRLAKRNVSLKSVEQAEPDISPLGHARQSIKIKQGIESAVAKQITGFIRDGKFKVTTQIQGDEVRVNSKSRDELQTVIAAVRAKEFPVAVQFVNFRD